MKADYLEGYAQCIHDFERALDESIRRNHGARTAHDGFFVMNDLIHYVHEQRMRIKSEQEPTRTIVIIGGM